MDAVNIQRWTVLEREVDDLGRLTRGAKSYKRTVVPQEERTEEFVRFTSRLRVTVSWGGVPIVAHAEFSLTSGRCIGNPNWIIEASQLKPLRKLARAAFPKQEKTSDEEEETLGAAPPPTEAAAAEVVAQEPAVGDHGAAERPAPIRQTSLFSEPEASEPTVRKVAS